MPANFVVDGFAGAGIQLVASSFLNIAYFEWDIERSILKLTDSNGKITNISCSDIATFVVVVAAFKVTTVTIAN